jgi:hypothetical protein
VQDFLGGLLVDLNLGLNNHVINQADVCSKTPEVTLGELLEFVSQSILLSLLGHTFILVGLGLLRVLEVLLLTGDLLFVELANEVTQTFGNLIDSVVVGSFAVSSVLGLFTKEIVDQEGLAVL